MREGAWHPRRNQCHDNDLSWGLFKSSQNTRHEFLRAVRHQTDKKAGTVERNVTLDFVRGAPFWGSCY